MNKEEIEKELNEVTGLDIKWSRLSKTEVEKLHYLFCTSEGRIKLLKAVALYEARQRGVEKINTILENVADKIGQILEKPEDSFTATLIRKVLR